MTTDAPPVTVACVSENRAEWFHRVLLLATSLRNFGGQLAAAPVHACFVGALDELYRAPLASLGVSAEVVDPWPCTRPQANKLRMLERVPVRPGAVLAALDCDLVVLGDWSDGISTDAVRATPAWTSPMRSGEWHEVLEALDMAPLEVPWTMAGSGETIPVPYVNSGVLFVPQRMIGPLLDAWSDYIERLDGGRISMPVEARDLVEQVALGFALLATRTPVELLPDEYNFHTKPPETAPLQGVGQVRIAHYHRWIDGEGFLRPPGYAPLGPDIERINRLMAGRRSIGVGYGEVSGVAAIERGVRSVYRRTRAALR